MSSGVLLFVGICEQCGMMIMTLHNLKGESFSLNVEVIATCLMLPHYIECKDILKE